MIECECTEGATMDRGFRFTPSAVATHNLTITIRDEQNDIQETKTVVLNAISKTVGVGTKQILCIGDSTTDSEPDTYLPGTGRTKYEMMNEFSDLIIADGGITPLFLGLRGVSPYKHQAHSGYSSDLFLTNNPTYPNPFWDAGNARNDFQKYMFDNANFGGANLIDFAFIQLGINDLKGGGSPSAVVDRFKLIIADILHTTRGYPTAKIVVSTTPYTPIDRTGWALHFFADSSYINFVENMNTLAKLVIAEFHENVAYPNVYVAPNLLFVDRKFGYPFAATDVSDRDATQENRYTDSVHPSKSGYKQAADCYYSRLRGLLV